MRALTGCIERANRAAKRCTAWCYYAPHPKDAMEEEGYFIPLWNYLSKTDEIRCLSEHSDGSWDEATFRVLHSETRCVMVKRVTDWVHYGLEIDGDLVMTDRGNGRYDIVDTGTKRTVAQGQNLMAAQAIIAAQSSQKRGPGRPRKDQEAA